MSIGLRHTPQVSPAKIFNLTEVDFQVASRLLALYVMQDHSRSVKGVGPGRCAILQELLCQSESRHSQQETLQGPLTG
jgi:hypothetical protein